MLYPGKTGSGRRIGTRSPLRSNAPGTVSYLRCLVAGETGSATAAETLPARYADGAGAHRSRGAGGWRAAVRGRGVRMIAYRVETGMMAPVIGAQGKKPNARRLLRALLTSDANLIPQPGAGTPATACSLP